MTDRADGLVRLHFDLVSVGGFELSWAEVSQVLCRRVLLHQPMYSVIARRARVPVDDAIGAAPGTVTSGERSEQRLADPVRVDGERGIAELQHGGGNGFREPLGNRSPRGRPETDLVPLSRFACHAPVTRRRARSWRTVAMSAPGSPRSRAARRQFV